MTGFALILAVLAATGTTRSNKYADAYRAFQEEGRPMVVLVGADWCPACRTMKGSSMPQALRSGAMKDVSFAVVDVDRSRALAGQLMQGSSIPQLIMYYKTDDGTRRVQLTGAHSAGQVQQFVAQAFTQPDEAPVTAGKPAEADTAAAR